MSAGFCSSFTTVMDQFSPLIAFLVNYMWTPCIYTENSRNWKPRTQCFLLGQNYKDVSLVGHKVLTSFRNKTKWVKYLQGDQWGRCAFDLAKKPRQNKESDAEQGHPTSVYILTLNGHSIVTETNSLQLWLCTLAKLAGFYEACFDHYCVLAIRLGNTGKWLHVINLLTLFFSYRGLVLLRLGLLVTRLQNITFPICELANAYELLKIHLQLEMLRWY